LPIPKEKEKPSNMEKDNQGEKNVVVVKISEGKT